MHGYGIQKAAVYIHIKDNYALFNVFPHHPPPDYMGLYNRDLTNAPQYVKSPICPHTSPGCI